MSAVVKKSSRKIGKGIAGISSLLPGPNGVKVGFPAGGDEKELQKAIWNEFGTRGGASGGGWGGPIPERPFMRNAMRDNRSDYNMQLIKGAGFLIREAIKGNGIAAAKRNVLGKLGIRARGDIQDEIVALSSPPNSPLTIELKGSDSPLIDTGMMKSSVRWEIDE